MPHAVADNSQCMNERQADSSMYVFATSFMGYVANQPPLRSSAVDDA